MVNKKSDFSKEKMEEILFGLYEAVEATKWHLENLTSMNARNTAIHKNIAKFDKSFKEAMSYLNLQEGVTYVEAKKQYKLMAKTVHPDKGGTEKEMQKLNDAFTIIEEYREWKTKN